MKSLEECVVTAMDGTDTELFSFLPYILQDIWEIGTDPDVVISHIRKHTTDYPGLKMLDLGCGKGAVSVKIAQELGCSCHGIDAIPEFINYADQKAKEYHVSNLCQFEVADIRERIKALQEYDVILLGAIGPVLGDYYATLTSLSKNLKPDGIVIIDDGYIENDSEFTHPLILKQEIIQKQIKAASMYLADTTIFNSDYLKNADDFAFENLKKRCLELIEKHPDKRQLFENYIGRQIEENDVLENKIVCSIMVVKRMAK